MEEWKSRTGRLLGADALNKLYKAHVAIFGTGGVGGFVAEGLARAGIGQFTLVDSDTVEASNINRQIIALTSTIGRYKTEVLKERILDINPNAEVNVKNCFFLPQNSAEFDFTEYDYAVDAVDTVTAKLEIVSRSKKAGVPVICAMGAGNKLDPTAFKVADIYATKMDPLSKVMRRELKKRGIDGLKVVYSEEKPAACRSIPGSISFVPSVMGLIIAGEVIKDITGISDFAI